jgi:hypothetical protein
VPSGFVPSKYGPHLCLQELRLTINGDPGRVIGALSGLSAAHPKLECRGAALSGLRVYLANLCPIHCAGEASHSRPCTTILHSKRGDCKRFLREREHQAWEPAKTGLRGPLR